MNVRSHRRVWFVWLRWTIAAVVVAGVALALGRAWGDLRREPVDWTAIQWWWLFPAVPLYWATLGLAWWFWHRLLTCFRQPTTVGRSCAAFFLSQLGKYVPGKAMVVVIRCAAVAGPGIAATAVAAAAFIETLTWIAIGAAIAGGLVVVFWSEHASLGWTAGIAMLLAGLPVMPPVIRRALSLGVVRRMLPGLADVARGLTYGVMWEGLGLLTLAWSLNALSLWCVMRAIVGGEISLADWPLALLAVTTSTVVGFMSLVPGGLGVRELVVVPILGPRVGAPAAIMIAVVIRVIGIAAETLAAVTMNRVARRRERSRDSAREPAAGDEPARRRRA